MNDHPYGAELSGVARLTVELLVDEETLERAEHVLDRFMSSTRRPRRLLNARVVAADWLPTDEQADLEEVSPGYEATSHDSHVEWGQYFHACADCRRTRRYWSHFARYMVPKEVAPLLER